MFIPSKKQSKKSGNWISIDYTIHDYKSGTAHDASLNLQPTNFDFNTIEDWRWEGKDWDNNDIFITCRKGSTNSLTFSENYPNTFKDQTIEEIKRILGIFN